MKYIPPDVGYADTNSATGSISKPGNSFTFGCLYDVPDRAMHNEKKDPENHAHTAVAGPPAARGDPQLAGTRKIVLVFAGCRYNIQRRIWN